MSEQTNQLLDKFDGDVKTYYGGGKKARKQKSIYGDQLICLAALLVMSVWKSGLRALVIAVVITAVCMLSDMLFCKMSGKTYNPKDLSTIAAGLCLALMMPSSVNYAIAVGAGLLAISVKHIFGGKDNYIFNPTCVAIAFLIICYPGDMLMYPLASAQPAVFGDTGVTLVPGVESYLLKLGTAPAVSLQNIILGEFPGPMGTTHFFVIAVCGICLLCRRSLSFSVTAAGLGSYCALTALCPVYSNIGDTIALELIGGYLLFGFVFLAADPQTMPKTLAGRITYGLIIGILGCLFRHFGKVEGSFVFVLLIANALSLRLDVLCAAAGRRIKAAAVYLQKNMGRYEKLRENAKSGESSGFKGRLSDTMEIIVPPTNYNMPPIDNKVTKINRKKTNIITRYAEKLRLKRKKEELIRKRDEERKNSSYMNAMRNMQKREKAEKTEKAGKASPQKTSVLHKIKQPEKKSLQKNNKQGK